MAKASQRQAESGDADRARPACATLDAADRDRLYRLAYRFAWNHADAEDAVQSAVATAVQRADQLRESDKWWTWLCSIVVQRCRELRRKESLWQRHAPRYAHLTTEDHGPSDDPTSALSDRLRELLPRLSARQYEVIVLRHLQGMNYEEIAEVLGITASTARVHAQAGRGALRELLFAERTVGKPPLE